MGDERNQALFLLTLISGVAMIGAGLLKLGSLTRFVSHSVMTGFLIGLAVDAVVIAVAASHDEPPPADTCGCPYARSWDGRDWRVEGECFSGSIFQAAARTDFLRLAHLAPVDGACRVRISDELSETDFVDEATLLVVDHPMGTTVVPSFAGEMHTLRNARPPFA